MSLLAAYVGTAGLVDMGYRFYNSNETVNGARITAGIVDAGGGWYSVDATIPAGATSVRWDSTGTTSAIAREYFYVYGTVPGSAGVDAIWAKTMTELSSVPGVTASTLSALQWVFLLARNKITSTSTTQVLRNDADSATIATSTVSDDGTTFTRGEFA
jgi:hypothetical protein